MANFANPTVGSNYTDFPDEIRASVDAALQMLSSSFGSHTNVPNGAIKWDEDNNKFVQKVDGSFNNHLSDTYNFTNVEATQIDLADNQRIRLGNSQDLQIYHSGNHSYVRDLAGTGNLRLSGSAIEIWNNDLSELSAKFVSSAQCELYYASVKRLETTSNGIKITDHVGIGRTATSPLDVAGNAKIGATDTTDAELTIGRTTAGNRNTMIDMIGDNTYTTYGLRITRLNGGANTESQLIHRGTGSFSLITQDAGAFQIKTSDTNRFYIHPTSGKVGIGLTSLSGVLHVQGSGTATELVTIASNLGSNNRNMRILAPAADNVDSPFTFQTGNSFKFQIDSIDCFEISSGKHIKIPNDTSRLKIGAGDDIELYHSGTNSFINNNTGIFYLGGNDIRLVNKALDKNYILCDHDGEDSLPNVSLYFNNDKRFKTISDGCQVERSTGDTLLIINALENNAATDAILRLKVSNSAADSVIQFGDNNDSDVGSIIYGHGSGTSDGDDMSFTTNAAVQMKLDWDGADARLGIGNTSASVKLHVTDDNPTIARLDRATANNSAIQFLNSTSSVYAGLAGNALGFAINVSTENLSNSPAFFVSRTNERIGIGNTSPEAAVHITSSGSGGVAGLFIEDSSNNLTAPFLHIRGKRNDDNNSYAFGGQIYLSCNKTNGQINSGKKLGTILFGGNHTDSSTSNELFSASISGVAAGNFANSGDMKTDLVFYTGQTGRTKNQTDTNVHAGTERLRILNTGQLIMSSDVGIGNTNPSEKLHVTGATKIDGQLKVANGSASNPAFSFFNDDNLGLYRVADNQLGISLQGALSGLFFKTTDNEGFTFGNPSTVTNIGMIVDGNDHKDKYGFAIGENGKRVRISSDTQGTLLSINTNVNETNNFFLSCRYQGTQIGSIKQNNSTSVVFNTSSDRRLKENIIDIKDALLTILKLKPKQYNWKKDVNKKSEHGFIAQDLLEDKVFDYAVSHDTEQDWYGLDYSRLVTIAIAAIQELSSKVSELETKVG